MRKRLLDSIEEYKQIKKEIETITSDTEESIIRILRLSQNTLHSKKEALRELSNVINDEIAFSELDGDFNTLINSSKTIPSFPAGMKIPPASETEMVLSACDIEDRTAFSLTQQNPAINPLHLTIPVRNEGSESSTHIP